MAIIGNGSIAKLLNDREGFVFFAAGVSDSRLGCEENRWSHVNREKKLLFEKIEYANNTESMLVYFSTISIFLLDSLYVRHKFHMEMLIRDKAKNYTIIRLGNVWECTNPNTFINAYKREPYEPRDEYKYMISKKQFNFVTDNLPRTGQHEISIFGEMLSVKECLERAKVMNYV
jgi:hypothetical protein